MFSSKYQEHTGIPYKGLWNQGSTCYLNSVLQVLFMTPDFREALERSSTRSLDSHLKELFDDLKKKNGNTCNIMKALGITDGRVQADAAECFEKILRKITNPEASQIFQGVLTVKNKCSKCNTETCDDNPCWSLPLELDSEAEYRVEDGIAQYFSPSEVSGPNQLFCEDCKAKTDFTVKLELKQHPEVLMLLLKRFKFDHYYKYYYKVQRRVEIPLILEIQSQTYELYAFVEHDGSLKCGHYTANIKSHEDEKWYHFNDNRVNHYYQFFQLDKRETSPSAYLLFYRKISAEEALKEENNMECSPESSETLRGETNEYNEETVESQKSHEMAERRDSEERQEEKEEESFKKKTISVEKEEDLKDQMMMNLKREEENLKDQMMMNLRKEVEELREQMMMNLKREEENLKDQMMMNLRKEVEELRKQMMKSLKKEEENFRDQMMMNFMKEEQLRDQMKMSLKREEELRGQMRMSVGKQKEEENMPEHQTKPLTLYDLYKNPLQSCGGENRVRSSKRSQELEGENRRRSSQLETKIYPGNPIRSSVNMETVEVQRGEHVQSSNVSPLVKGFESLSNEACGQSREDPSNMNVEHDEESRTESGIQQRDSSTDARNRQRTNEQLHQTGGTTLTNDRCDDGSDSVQRPGRLHRSSISVSLQNQSPGEKYDSVQRSNVEKRKDSENSCKHEDHQTERSNKILQQDATCGSYRLQHCHDTSRHYSFQQHSTEMTPANRAPSTCDPVSGLTKSLQTMTLTDSQTHLPNKFVKTESCDQQMLYNAHYGSGNNLVSPNHHHFAQTDPNLQSHAACLNPLYSGHNIPENTDSWSQQIIYYTQHLCNNPMSPVPVCSYPMYQYSPGIYSSYSGHNMPAENFTAPTDSSVISTPFGSSVEPMHHIVSPFGPADSQSGSGIRTSTQFRSESLKRETRAELSHDCRSRESADSQVQVEDSIDPDVIRRMCSCLYPKIHRL